MHYSFQEPNLNVNELPWGWNTEEFHKLPWIARLSIIKAVDETKRIELKAEKEKAFLEEKAEKEKAALGEEKAALKEEIQVLNKQIDILVSRSKMDQK